MAAKMTKIAGIDAHVSRSGYTGEDGYEISLKADRAAELWRRLVANSEVKPVGLGARNSLRLEAGLCLYGHDIDTTTSPIEAGLIWSIQKRRRTEGGFPGAARIMREIAEGPSRVRVGLKPDGRAPAREGAPITTDGREVGIVTSGGFGPTVNGPVAGLRGARRRCTGDGAFISWCAASRWPRASLPCRSRRIATSGRKSLREEGKTMTTHYTKDHEYIRVEGDTGTVGITDYAQQQLGDVVYVELPSVGKAVEKGGEAHHARNMCGRCPAGCAARPSTPTGSAASC